jgi:hypothetical protein
MGMLRKKIGSFYLVEKIGSGGMSEVFLAINPRTREKRSIKILGKRAAGWPAASTRFLREMDIVRSLSHPGIIKILDGGSFEDCCYYSMEFVPGGNLTRRLGRGKIPIGPATKLFMGVCEAMAYAHDKGFIHRNLKPSNILIHASGDPVLCDFAAAKAMDFEGTSLTQSGEVLGTIAYLAPEQRFNSKSVDRRADVYALGAILYEMLMGFPPLGKFPWPREIQSSFPESLQTILEKCLAVNPKDRFAHAGFLLFEFKKFRELQNGNKIETSNASNKGFPSVQENSVLPAKMDRIESWFRILRTGTTRERLAAVREMVDKMEPSEAKAVLKLYSQEGDRVRWGLIRVLGELKIASATPLILSDLKNPFHSECAIKALGKIGSEEAFDAIREFVVVHPESALIALLPLASTGKEKAIRHLQHYLEQETAILRQAAARALALVATAESLQILKEHLCVERDEKVRLSLLQAVHTLEAVLLPGLNKAANSAETLSKTKQVCRAS